MMTMSNTKRISVDLKDVQLCNREPDLGVSVVLNNELRGFDAFLKGPVGTPYEGGTFKVRITIPPNYPISPPEALFLTKVWHPNISSQTGYTCLDILAGKWLGCMNFRTVLLSLQNLLANPEADDPQDPVVGGQALRDKDMFEVTAKMWTHIHAAGKDFDEGLMGELKRMTEMGYEQGLALSHLSANDWDLAEALETINNV